MTNHRQKEQEKNHTPEADLVVPVVNNDPEGNPIYHPAIGSRALWGGLLGGVIVALLVWLIGSGVWPIVGLGQLASATPGVTAYFGFVIGSAIGGLAGGLSGLRYMLMNHIPEDQPPTPDKDFL